MNHLGRHFIGRRQQLALAALALLSGCGALSPYNHMPLAPGAAPNCQSADAASGCSNGSRAQLAGLAGGMGDALVELEERRTEVYRQLDSSAVRRNLGAQSLFGLIGWAAYTGLKPDPTNADQLRATRLAVTASTLYMGTSDSLNSDQESVQARSYSALTCLALQSEPLMWPAAPTAGSAGAAAVVKDRATLQARLDELQTSIDEGYLALGLARGGYDAKQMSPRAAKVVQRLESALNLARTALREGHVLADAIDQSGALLRYRTAALVGASNAELQSRQKALPEFNMATTQMSGMLASLNAVGKDTEAEEKTTGSGTKDSGGQEGDGSPAPSAPGTSGTTTGGQAAAPAASAAASAPASAGTSSAGARKPEVAGKSTKSATAPSTAASAATPAQPLPGKLCLDAGDQPDQAVCKHRISDHLAATPEGLWRQGGRPASLQWLTERIHQARRPVMLTLVKFRQAMRTVQGMDGCGGLARVVEITPDQPDAVVPGGSTSLMIALADGRLPRAGLLGAQRGALKATLSLAVDGGVVVATVEVPAQFPPGDLTLWATDSQGRNRREVKIPVSAKPN